MTRRQKVPEADKRRKCHATAKSTGKQCGNYAIPGGTVCLKHGGAAPQVAKAARMRLLELVDPAIAALAEIVQGPTAEWRALDPGNEKRAPVFRRVGFDPQTKLAAAEAILDRTGYPRRHEVDLSDARARLLERLRARQEVQR